MKHIDYQTINEANERNQALYEAGILANYFSTSDTSKFADIIERQSKFWLPFEEQWQNLYTSQEILRAVELPMTRADELAQSEELRKTKMRNAIAYLEGVLTTQQRNTIGFAIAPYMQVYYLGDSAENNAMMMLLENAQFVGQFQFLTEEMIDELKTILA